MVFFLVSKQELIFAKNLFNFGSEAIPKDKKPYDYFLNLNLKFKTCYFLRANHIYQDTFYKKCFKTYKVLLQG